MLSTGPCVRCPATHIARNEGPRKGDPWDHSSTLKMSLYLHDTSIQGTLHTRRKIYIFLSTFYRSGPKHLDRVKILHVFLKINKLENIYCNEFENSREVIFFKLVRVLDRQILWLVRMKKRKRRFTRTTWVARREFYGNFYHT